MRQADGIYVPLLYKRVTNTPEIGTNRKKSLDFFIWGCFLWFDIIAVCPVFLIHEGQEGRNRNSGRKGGRARASTLRFRKAALAANVPN